MKRTLLKNLIDWKNDPEHMPLLIRGARQVGKTFLVEHFGEHYFKNKVSINFEFKPEYKTCFTSMDPEIIVNRLSLLSHQPIRAGETLLFLDEIQECPGALQSLRYFKEKMPSLHVIAAGSLLEFLLNSEGFRMPVGRIQSLYLKPLSFYEYLDAMDRSQWIKYCQSVDLKTEVDPALHQTLLDCVKDYLVLGGMPAVVHRYAKEKNYLRCQELQAGILDTYRNDFGKYAKYTHLEALQLCFSKAPGLIGQTLKYSHISQDVSSSKLKSALQLLSSANVLYWVHATHASGLPLSVGASEKRFKLIFLDVGLAQYTAHLGADILLAQDVLLLHRGQLAEQFVGQELLTTLPFYERSELFYWEREKASSTAEVDYVTHVGSQIVPIEVKAGKTGRLKSLQVFLTEKKFPLGVKISQSALSLERHILSLPLYMIPEMRRLIQVC